MKAGSTAPLASFVTAAGTIGVAALLTQACPGGCVTCGTCATSLVPIGSAFSAVGVAFAGSALFRARNRRPGTPGLKE